MISTTISKDLLQPPPSPSLSATSSISSWLRKSPSELVPMLKNAYTTLKDKERDLRLAAEIGKSLLENNIALKSNYEDLLSQSIYPTPSNSYSLLDEQPQEDVTFMPSHTTREAMIEMLEKKNTELSTQLEQTVQTQEKQGRMHKKKERELETEIKFLKGSLDHATVKIQEMEEKTMPKDSNKLSPPHHEEEDVSLLHEKIKHLRLENDQVYQSKLSMEEKLMKTLHDLRLLKQQVDQFQFTLHDHEQLQKSFEAQHTHIQELKASLEEHRTLLGQLKEQGVIYYEEEEYEEEESNQNLLSELHHAWLKGHEDNTNLLESILVQAGVVEKDALDDALSLIGRLEHEYDHKKFLKENGHWYDDNFSMVSTQQKAAIVTLLPPTPPPEQSLGLVGSVQRMVKQMLYFTWRWFRFTLIMTIAVFLSLKEGPPPPPRKSGLITSTASHTKQ
ncbi:uncharacterized protein B0P05DRAFT_521686 [Gilbertella persicaria]|uniref:uncharacterized protein n=1 Tax=Gilbertella persicaria TaxID=101096 RepID=UPI002220211A|nr:uncharacterized protein B0P05DRAFT_521686 [Gilbertella persicaria]KAI8098380.1 hypothetical protein B0P05DRAFT_521686 [Gilbertella persicaria]